jgi:hypothetical protein
MNPSQEPTPEPILRFESPDEIDDAVESMLHPTFDECDDEALLELDDEYWEALLLDDDYEVLPEEGDFWTDQEAA